MIRAYIAEWNARQSKARREENIMSWEFDKRLRRCSAWVEDITPSNPVQVFKEGYLYGHIIHGKALKSYGSIVAFFDSDENILFLMPRYDYSMTTMQQLRKFVDDYTHIPHNYSVKDIRRGAYNYIITCHEFKRIGYDNRARTF